MDVRETDRLVGLTLPAATEEDLEEEGVVVEDLEEEDPVVDVLAEEEYLAEVAEANASIRLEYILTRGKEKSRPLVIPRYKRRLLPQKLWQAVAERRRCERIGLDLICFTCRDFISKSEILEILCHFYPPGGYWESPVTRCYFECPHCTEDIVLGRNVGDADNFHIIGGAFPANTSENQQGNASSSDPNLKDEAYPDALLDSPNDILPHAVKSAYGFVVY